MSKYPRIAGVNYESMVDGEGVRAVIFLSGCSHHCPECHNHAAQDPNYGVECTDELLEEIADEIKKRPFISGITLSGGDPFYDVEKTRNFLMALSERYIEKGIHPQTVWIYTGYTFDEIADMYRASSGKRLAIYELLTNCEVLVDGRFEKELADKRLAFRGSSNQRIIDVKKSILSADIVPYEVK